MIDQEKIIKEKTRLQCARFILAREGFCESDIEGFNEQVSLVIYELSRLEILIDDEIKLTNRVQTKG